MQAVLASRMSTPVEAGCTLHWAVTVFTSLRLSALGGQVVTRREGVR